VHAAAERRCLKFGQDVESTAVAEVDDERHVDVVRGQLHVGHLTERATVDPECRPFAQSAVGDVELLHQLLKLLDGEPTHVAVGRNDERL